MQILGRAIRALAAFNTGVAAIAMGQSATG